MSPLVAIALQDITEGTNLRTGLTHPNDMAAAKDLFMRLHRAGEVLDGAEISAWAREHGWQTRDALALGQLGEKIGSGGRVRLPRHSPWPSDILEQLRARAELGKQAE